jgi:hypothetical protein
MTNLLTNMTQDKKEGEDDAEGWRMYSRNVERDLRERDDKVAALRGKRSPALS